MKSFAYKQQKTVTFGLLNKGNSTFVKERKNKFSIPCITEQVIYCDEDHKDSIYGENLQKLKNIFHSIKDKLDMIFIEEKYHSFGFSYAFSLIERKKLQSGRIAEKSLKDKIWRKYGRQFENLCNNISTFDGFLEENEESLSRISYVVRVIRYIKGDIQKISHFILNYEYSGDNLKKKNALDGFRKFIDKNGDFLELLDFYSKLDKEQFEEYKIALNPAILNTHSEINQKNWENNLNILKNKLDELKEKNQKNKNTKRLFEEDLEAYINYILYQKNFFKQSKNTKYKEKIKEIYERYTNLTPKDKSSDNLVIDRENLVFDFIEKNKIKLKDSHEIEKKTLDRYIKQEEKTNELENLKKRINFIQLKTFLYELTWERAKIKENNKKLETKQEYQKLSEYVAIIKGEINNRLKNPDCLYGEFIKPNGQKAKTAQKLGQIYGEYMQKLNFDTELKLYTHFAFIVRKGKRFFIKPYKKEDILNENQGFTLEDAEKLIQQNRNDNGEYETFLLQSLTLKGLMKLIFIKNAFKYNFEKKYKEIYDIWKRKTYYKNFCDSEKVIKFLLESIFSEDGQKLFPYVKNNFKEPHYYDYFYEFEQDLLKNSYEVKQYTCNFDEKELIELDIVDRKFEHSDQEDPRLKRQSDIHVFVEGFFDKLNFNFIRMLPEIKIFIRYQKFFGEIKKRLVNCKEDNDQGTSKDVGGQERFYKNIAKASFMLELNPFKLWKKPEEMKNLYKKCITDKYKDKNEKDFHIISVDIGENSFATVGVYDKDLKPKQVDVELLPQNKNDNTKNKIIIDITDLKAEKGKIIQTNTKNSKKYKSYKYIFEQIVLSQIYLGDVLENIGVIEITEKNYNDIKNKISQSVNKISGLDFNMNDIDSTIKNTFPQLKDGLKTFLFDYIKSIRNAEDKTINITKHYNQIFEKLELQKVINFKDAFGANFIGVIKEILKKYPGIIVFESLHTGDNYGSYNDIIKKQIKKSTSEKGKEVKTFGTYVGAYIVKSLVQSFSKIVDIENQKIHQWIYFDKNYETTIGKEKYSNNGILFFVDEKNTSSACPVCNGDFIQMVHENGEVVENKNIKKLFGHGKGLEFEKSMHHYSENNKVNYGKYVEQAKKTENNDCKYHIQTNPCGFDFIKSGDDLATYNIAKKAKEYLEVLLEDVSTSEKTSKQKKISKSEETSKRKKTSNMGNIKNPYNQSMGGNITISFPK